MLYQLADHAPNVLTHGLLATAGVGTGGVGKGWLLRNVVKVLKCKRGSAAASPKYILTEPKVGYWMAEPEAGAQDQE